MRLDPNCYSRLSLFSAPGSGDRQITTHVLPLQEDRAEPHRPYLRGLSGGRLEAYGGRFGVLKLQFGVVYSGWRRELGGCRGGKRRVQCSHYVGVAGPKQGMALFRRWSDGSRHHLVGVHQAARFEARASASSCE